MILGHLLTLALRGLWRHKATTALNLLALVLGLLAFLNSAGNVVLVHNSDSLWPNADRIVQFTQQTTVASSGVPSEVEAAISFRAADYLKADFPALEGVARLRPLGQRPLLRGDRTAFPQIFAADGDFPRILVWPLKRGEWKTALERPDGVVLGPAIATTLFGDENPLGATVSVHGRDLVVTGVLGTFPEQVSQFQPQNMMLVGRETGEFLDYHQGYRPEDWLEAWTYTFALLPPGLDRAEFDRDLASFGDRHVPKDTATIRLGAVPLSRGVEIAVDTGLHTDKTGLSYSSLMTGLGTIVLIVACLNYANLSAAIAASRFREMGLRALLGESRAALLGQGMIEAAIVSLCALILLLGLLVALAPLIDRIPGLLNWRYIFHQSGFWSLTALGTVAAAISGGLYPAWLLAQCRPHEVIKGRRSGTLAGRLSTTLVALQFFAASLLLITGAIAYNQGQAMQRFFSPQARDMLLFDPGIPDGRSFRSIHDRLISLPGVRSVSGMTTIWQGQGDTTVGLARQGGTRIETEENDVGPDFFTTIGARLLAGRDFSPDHADDVAPADEKRSGAVTNVIIDRPLAELLGWTPTQAIGRTLFEFGPGWSWQQTVIGVSEDRPISLTARSRRGTIFHFHGNNVWYPLIRVSRDHVADTTQAVTAALNDLAPSRPVRLNSEDMVVSNFTATLRTTALFFGGLALFAFIIAVIGLAGMAFHTTGRRLHEIGIRKTLGASTAVILRLLLTGFARPVVLATVASWPVAYLAAEKYLSLFSRRDALSVLPFLTSLAVSLGVAILAVGVQTLRAARGNPADILRHE